MGRPGPSSQPRFSSPIAVAVPTVASGTSPAIDVSMFNAFTLWFQINGANAEFWCEVSASPDTPGAIWYNPGYLRSFNGNTVQNFSNDTIDANLFNSSYIWATRMRAFRLYCYSFNSGPTPLAYIIGEYL
jgi:hypothetical protein